MTEESEHTENLNLHQPPNQQETRKMTPTKVVASDRGKWAGKFEFLFSCLSYNVGLGNLWRFPYLCYRNGGGAFLIPYTITLIFTGVPLFFLELAFGQYASTGVVSIWKICPILQGAGWGMFIMSTLISVYYNMIVAYILLYLCASFTSYLPWTDCDNYWNTEDCSINSTSNANTTSNLTMTSQINNMTSSFYNDSSTNLNSSILVLLNETIKNRRVGPSDEYLHHYVLDISEGFHDFGSVRWQPALCLLGCWFIVGACLIGGIKTSGKAVYFTATFPYLVLLILLIRCCMLPGYTEGVLFYIKPQWQTLASAKVWGDAAVQIFFSLGPCWGGLITLASYNNFHHDCLRDSIILSLGNCLTSLFAGFVVFGVIGFMAHELDVGVGDVVKQGAGLAFIVYPEMVTKLPVSPLWAILFFAMLMTLGIGTQLTVVNTVYTTILDEFSTTLRRGYRPQLVLVLLCSALFLLGLVFCTNAGMFVVQLMDNYAATYSALILSLVECVAIAWLYGADRFSRDIETMIRRRISPWWKICWKYITPVFVVIIMIFTWSDFKRSRYGDYVYPKGADGLGWGLVMLSLIPIPAVAVYRVCTERGTLAERIRKLIKPAADWGPSEDRRLSTPKQQQQLQLQLLQKDENL